MDEHSNSNDDYNRKNITLQDVFPLRHICANLVTASRTEKTCPAYCNSACASAAEHKVFSGNVRNRHKRKRMDNKENVTISNEKGNAKK